jgi:excisionase family DNA binding protein
MPDNRDPSQFLSVTQLAAELQINRNTAYKLLRDGDIRSCRPGGRIYRVARVDFEAWLAEQAAR